MKVTQRFRKRLWKLGCTVGQKAWEQVKSQPPVQKKILQVQKKWEHFQEHVDHRFQQLESDFWAWIKRLEEESPYRPSAGPSLSESYQILGIKPTSSFAEVKSVWREEMRKYHPDRFVSQPDRLEQAQKKAQEINEAYQRIKQTFNR